MTPPPPQGGTLDQIVMVIFENAGLDFVYSYPTFKTLADQNFLFRNWSDVGHPSEPNYVAIAFGDTLGVSSDGFTNPLPAPTFLDLIHNTTDPVTHTARTWQVIQNGSRGADHNAFLLESPQPAGGSMIAGDVPQVLAAVNAGTNFVWFTPDDNQNGHDPNNDYTYPNTWLAGWLPNLLQAMNPRKSLLIVTTDEGSGGDIIYTVFAGNAAKKGVSQTAYNHYSFAKLIETVWGGGNLGRQDVSAPTPSEGLT